MNDSSATPELDIKRDETKDRKTKKAQR